MPSSCVTTGFSPLCWIIIVNKVVTSMNNYLVYMRLFYGVISIKIRYTFYHIFIGSVEKVYSQPVFSHSYALIILTHFLAGCVTYKWPIQ